MKYSYVNKTKPKKHSKKKLVKAKKSPKKIFKSKLHKVYTVEVNKIALSFNDDKCFIMDNNIDTLTHGHYKIKSML